MAKKLIGEFLTELAEDVDKLRTYLEDRDDLLGESGLSDEQQEVLRSNDLKRIRDETYDDIVAEILSAVRSGTRVCVALYGHPGVFARPAHEAVRRARAEGFPARMLPAVSAEDCLFADLGVDPGENGCQSYEATDFLLRKREVDVSAALVLWQISV